MIHIDQLLRQYELSRLNDFTGRSVSPELLQSVIDTLARKDRTFFKVQTSGYSFENRPITVVTVGTGNTAVLLWSQMHGDESTATMAIGDILNYLFKTREEESTRQLLAKLSLHFLPMLNPDGAARQQRRTVQGIDMNRDALALQTPEATILRNLRDKLKPAFGFNLHDQELSTVGTTKELSAIALLAPAYDIEKSDNEVRRRAKHVASVFGSAMNSCIPGKVSRYDDSFEPRAFGDNMQQWGTSTILVESGHSIKDPEKQFIRKLNFVGIVASLFAIATDEFKKSDLMVYEKLPFNGKRAYDVIVRGISIDHENGKTTRADLGVSYQVDTHSENPPKLVDIGDLHTFVGLKEVDGKDITLPQSALALGKSFEWEQR